MEEIRVLFDDGDSIICKYGNLELRDKRNFGYCPYEKVEKYELLFWEDSIDSGIDIVIGNEHMKESKAFFLPPDSQYCNELRKVYSLMVEKSHCIIQENKYKAMSYKIPYRDYNIGNTKETNLINSKIKNESEDNQAHCPRCGSISLVANKKGYGFGKAVVSTALFGILPGVFIGGIGRNKVEVTCLKCSKKFKV